VNQPYPAERSHRERGPTAADRPSDAVLGLDRATPRQRSCYARSPSATPSSLALARATYATADPAALRRSGRITSRLAISPFAAPTLVACHTPAQGGNTCHSSAPVIARTQPSEVRTTALRSPRSSTNASPAKARGLHRHVYDETWVIEEGNITFQVGEERFKAGPGHVAIIPSGVPQVHQRRPGTFEDRLHPCQPEDHRRVA
jgi:mannose-6-phosphate isomerase-like protein (cupin superfamily)